ncbi:rhodanese-like domain-containing protein [Dysgonomonas mossii]|uniref:Rhodanese-like domain-containing protein n=1 Tax=Dysgonomonas mossii TaxID=163665 RepID=A0A4Y9ISE4_9BACT|nr:rhodanese-like domain-containing protein [Dysgonomonas mossii]MBF0760381.1 rhodanese-like domain-containing protein [Dysgonomonas mossii]TFU91321.1 rhodanese-like domain-containing protein [Dysgonomonas mossii]
MKLSYFLFTIILSLVSLSIDAQIADTDTLRSLAARKGTVIVDVRTVEEYDEGHIGSSINIPLQILGDSIESLKHYEKVIVICRSGRRSAKAKAEFEEAGFTNVYNGGGWEHLKAILEAREEE